ncbi:MAG: type I methionyl aminopeptidase [Verrucomicrobia bacterium]|nr:type I methionyl aminopeptidase [Verrucomicrobiota bacterium]
MSGPRCKSPEEIALIRKAGEIAARVLREASVQVIPGMTTRSLDRLVGELILGMGGASAFLGYRDFPANCCISVNEGVVHGIGNERRLQFGDIVKLDVGVRYKGYVGDVAMTLAVGGCSPLSQKLMDVTVAALYKGIAQATAGNRITDISRAIQRHVESNQFSVVREFVGHGVGQSVHEEPQIPNYIDDRHSGRLKPGWTIAIEPMVNVGGAAVEILADQWTVVTRDRQLSAHFEHTVLITDGPAEILTRDGMTPLY